MSPRLLAVLLALLAAPARAAYEDLGAGARGPGMGGAVVAIADDVYTIHYNPAGLGTLDRPQFGAAYSRLQLGLDDGSNLSTSFIGYAHPLLEGRRGTIATAWNSFSLDGSLYREDSFYLSYGRLAWSRLKNELHLGGSLKYLRSSFGNFSEASNATVSNTLAKSGQPDPLLADRSQGAFDTDLGALYKFGKHYSLGLQIAHVNQPNVAFHSGEKDTLPFSLKLGLNYRSLISNLVGQYETQKGPTGRQDQIFTIAAERWFPRLFTGDIGVRGGMTIGTRDYRLLSMGLSYQTRRLGFDYGFGLPINMVSGVAGTHRLAMNFKFGRTTDNEEALELVLEMMRQLKGRQAAPREIDRRGLSPAQTLTVSELISQADGLMRRARYAAALEKWTQALTVAPADKGLMATYGRLNFVGRQIKSLPNFQTDALEAAMHRGLLAYINGDEVEAVQRLSEALAMRPGFRELDVFLAQLELMTGIKRFTIERAPDYTAATLLAQADTAIAEGRYDAAIELALQVVKLEPENAAAWQDLGTAYFALNDFESSARAWRKALEFERSPSVRAEIKGYLKSIARAQDRGQRVARQAPPLPNRTSISPQEVQELFNRGVDHFTKREFEEARKAFEEILEADPSNIEAQKALKRVKEELP